MSASVRLPDVTLLCVETHRVPLALIAMQRCMRDIEFADALLLTPQTITPPPRMRVVPIAPLQGVRAYSDFMLHQLASHVATSHVLVAQWDGFVVDATQWDDAFLQFDYIGAPWPDGRVGNGGFSLRSRRLTDALQRIDIPDPHPEDACICVRHRDVLERDYGIRFAPLDVAQRFAFERVEPTRPTFGVHAFFNFDRVFGDAELAAYFDQCDDALLFSTPARRLLRNCHRSGMTQAAAALHARRMRGSLGMRFDALKLRLAAPFKRGRRVT